MNKNPKKDSPCVSVCSIEEGIGFCRGCLRSLDEIARWNALSKKERNTIIAELDKRRVLHQEALKSPYSN